MLSYKQFTSYNFFVLNQCAFILICHMALFYKPFKMHLSFLFFFLKTLHNSDCLTCTHDGAWIFLSIIIAFFNRTKITNGCYWIIPSAWIILWYISRNHCTKGLIQQALDQFGRETCSVVSSTSFITV